MTLLPQLPGEYKTRQKRMLQQPTNTKGTYRLASLTFRTM